MYRCIRKGSAGTISGFVAQRAAIRLSLFPLNRSIGKRRVAALCFDLLVLCDLCQFLNLISL